MRLTGVVGLVVLLVGCGPDAATACKTYQDNQDKIRAAGGGPGICTTTPPYSASSRFQSACKTLLENCISCDQASGQTAAHTKVVCGAGPGEVQ